MNKRFLPILVLLAGLFLPARSDGSVLQRVTRVDLQDTIQLYLFFDSPPRYSTRRNAKRLDLIFEDSTAIQDLELFAPDERVVKILSRNHGNKYILSLYFRYQPQKVNLSPAEEATVVLEVLLGNKYSKSYQKLAERLKGLTLLDRSTIDLSNPLVRSPYRNDWWSFFSTYEAPITIGVPVRFTLPPFPIIQFLPPENSQNLSIFSESLLKQADDENWDQVKAELLLGINGPHSERERKLLALTLGEVLARADDFENSYKQLYLLQETYPEELLATYARFLLGYLQAVHQSPYLANFDLAKLPPSLPPSSFLVPYLQLLRIEAALASSDLQQLNRLLLQEDIGYPETVRQRVSVRQADYWYSIGQPVKAIAAYGLVKNLAPLWAQPYSTNGYCSTLYSLKKYREAAECYHRLSGIVEDKATLALVNFRQYMAQLHFTNRSSLLDDFLQLENAFPNNDTGRRATIKRVDIELLEDREKLEESAAIYHQISNEAVDRYVREEALFKEALTYKLRAENATAIQLIQRLLREFRVGNTRDAALALLIDILPGEIQRRSRAGDYIGALVLAKQNRLLFRNNWIDAKFLVDIAESYRNVGLFNEAEQLYLYIIGTVPLEQREQYYLPMIISAFEQGQYTLVEDYSAQYSYNYPEGSHAIDILYYRLQALAASGRLREALSLLPEPLPPHDGIIGLAALLNYRTENYRQCLEAIERIEPEKQTDQDRFLHAECLFREQRYQQAKPIYAGFPPDSEQYNHAQYRLAEIARLEGDQEKNLMFLKNIVETGKDDQWKKLAEQELQVQATINAIPLLRQ